MSLEGRIRELGLHEVCQLLGLSRKTGRLHVRAPLHGIAAEIVMVHGAVVDAASWTVQHDAPAVGIVERPRGLAGGDARAVEQCVLELLAWTDGAFRFVACEPSDLPSSRLRLAIEPLLVEAAQRAEVWERVADRIPGARSIVAFVDVEPQQLPLLRLVPQEWEILTRVDGRRDLSELASVLGRDLLDVVQIVHSLIGAGLLTVREGERIPRRHATPPTAHVAVDASDLWIPSDDADALFDPVETGMTTFDGLPRMRTPLAHSALFPDATAVRIVTESEVLGVASPVREPSYHRGEPASREAGMDAATSCRLGDEAARRGDLAGALALWSSALRPEASGENGDHRVDADRIREAIALAARLHALLHPSMHDAPET